jgi:radical SAM protein (TIGR01212 family)
MGEQTYRKLGNWLRERFGEPVHKLGVAAGFPCPNRDGTLSASGCSFCNPAGSLPAGITPGASITGQLASRAPAVTRRFGAHRFIAYFQDCTPTNCDPDELKPMLEEASGFPGVVGLAICTRPDCLNDDMLEMLAGMAERTLIWIEVGLQSASDETLRRINRNSSVSDCSAALERLHSRGILTALHVILGLPGEAPGDILDTARFVNESGSWGLKIHNLHILRGTPMEKEYADGRIALPSLDEYAAVAAAFLRRLNPEIVIHRVVGDAPASILLAPQWMLDKQAVLRAVDLILAGQGR